MKEESGLERMIKYRKYQLTVYSIGFPLIMCIPFALGCVSFSKGNWKFGLLFIGIAVSLLIFIIACIKSARRSILVMEKELEEMKKLKEKFKE